MMISNIIIFIIIFILSLIVGYRICYLINYKPQIEDPYNLKKQHLILTWNSQNYHIHHWITFSIIIILLFLGRYCSFCVFLMIIGLSLGCVFEGFLFDDWYKIKI